MGLDLSKLFGTVNDTTEAPIEKEIQSKGIEVSNNTQSPSESLSEPHRGKIYNKLEKDRENKERARKVYDEYQRNTKRTEQLRSQINRGIAEGAETEALLLQALECISLMTDDKLFYSMNRDRLKNRKV